jgi:hypothetical protein
LAPDALARFAAPLVFRIAEKFFKFLSWAIVLVAIQYGHAVTGNAYLGHLHSLAMTIWSTALGLQAFYLAVRDPETLNVPAKWHGASRVVQMIGAVAMLMVSASPFMILDHTIEALAQARPK